MNDGHEDGEFNFEYSGTKPIALVPSAGHVDALSTLPIRVEYVATEPGAFHEFATYAQWSSVSVYSVFAFFQSSLMRYLHY